MNKSWWTGLLVGVLAGIAFAWLTVGVVSGLRDSLSSLALPLVIGGAIGGIAQALLTGEGKWKGWSYDGTAKPPVFDVGNFADLFIGVVGAVASLVLGTTLLNQELLTGRPKPSQSPPVATAHATGSAPAPEALKAPGNPPPVIPIAAPNGAGKAGNNAARPDGPVPKKTEETVSKTPAPAPETRTATAAEGAPAAALSTTEPPASKEAKPTDTGELIPVWLRILSFGALAGFAARALLPDLAKQLGGLLGSPKFQKVLNENVQATVNTKTQVQQENLRSALEVARLEEPRLPSAPLVAAAAPGVQPPAAIEQLRVVVARYPEAVNSPDYGARVQARHRLANEVLQMIFSRDISADEIAHQIPGEQNDGWCLALASRIAAAPGAGDGTRLLNAAQYVTHKYVQYRICLALFALKVARLLTPEEEQRAAQLLIPWTTSDDPSLKKKAQATLDFIRH